MIHPKEPTPELYEELLKEIRKDPSAILRERRLDQLVSLKLVIPDIIRAHKKNRRYHYEMYETAKAEIDKAKAEITLAIKTERDPITNKFAFANREAREVEIIDRVAANPSASRWEAKRRQMYAQAKGLEDEIDYFSRIDQSLVEILALMTSQIEYETRYERSYTDVSKRTRSLSRSSGRAAKVAVGDQTEALVIA